MHRALGKINMPMQSFVGNDRQRTTAIMRSMAAGFYLQAAVASDPDNFKAPFWLMKDYAVNPTSADLHMGCALRSYQGARRSLSTRSMSSSCSALQSLMAPRCWCAPAMWSPNGWKRQQALTRRRQKRWGVPCS